MATVPETQALLDEMAAPSIHTLAQLNAWIAASAEVVKLFGQQIALVRGLLQEAEGVEPNIEVEGKMATLIQQLDAQTRIIGNLAKEGRSLRTSLKLLKAQVIEFNALAEAAGYTIT